MMKMYIHVVILFEKKKIRKKTSTNHVSRSKCNSIEVHIRRVINSVPNFIECNDIFDTLIISLKH